MLSSKMKGIPLNFTSALLVLIISVSAFEEFKKAEPIARIVKPTKYGNVTVEVIDGISTKITFTKTDSIEMFMHLRLDAENVTKSTNTTVVDLGPDNPWINIKHDDVVYDSIGIMPGSQRISVIRKMPLANVPIPSEHVTGRFTDCFSLKEYVNWMGGPQLKYQRWPIQDVYLDGRAYIPSHEENMGIAERYWLSSEGFSIWLNDYSTIFVDQNNIRDKHLCFVTENKSPYKDTSLQIGYQLGFSNDSRETQEFTGSHYWIPPVALVDEKMIKYPIWSTFGKYGKNINETIINNFADEINAHNFSNSQLEIGDGWESCYGSKIMNPNKFPNATRLVESLKNKGFRITLWTHPFINSDCQPFYDEAVNGSYFVKNFNDSSRTTWWNVAEPNEAGIIDFTYSNATVYFVNRLKALKDLGISGFNFDSAEASRLPQIPKFYYTNPSYRPSYFTETYARAVSRYFGNNSIINAGWRTQNIPMFIRMANKDRKFTWSNGLPTLITTLLEMSLAGYYFILPDVMGGSGPVGAQQIDRPSKNLYLRWVAITVFMPAMHFSIPPWDYDDETVAFCKKFVSLHEEMSPIIMKHMRESLASRVPLYRPVWWLEPTTPRGFEINDEFLLGDEILVAPIIEETVFHRDIYLPNGTWYDPITYRQSTGPTVLPNYVAKLDSIPYFIRQK